MSLLGTKNLKCEPEGEIFKKYIIYFEIFPILKFSLGLQICYRSFVIWLPKINLFACVNKLITHGQRDFSVKPLPCQ